MKNRKVIVVSTIIMCLVGVSFILSAFTKLTGVDEFELYIYNHKILGFDLSSIAARLIISLEFAIGILLIIGFYHNGIRFIALGVLILFSLFLVWKLLTGSAENCHCFGSAIDLKPYESLLKNAVLIVLVLIGRRRYSLKMPWSGLVTAGIISAAIVIPLVLSPPDIIYNRIYKPVVIDEGYEQLHLSEQTLPYDKGRRIILFFSPSCPVCRLTARKAVTAAERSGTGDQLLFYFFGDEGFVDDFRVETRIKAYPYSILPTREIIEVTGGFFPTVLFLEDGVIKKRSSYRDLFESDFININ